MPYRHYCKVGEVGKVLMILVSVFGSVMVYNVDFLATFRTKGDGLGWIGGLGAVTGCECMRSGS